MNRACPWTLARAPPIHITPGIAKALPEAVDKASDQPAGGDLSSVHLAEREAIWVLFFEDIARPLRIFLASCEDSQVERLFLAVVVLGFLVVLR